MWNRCGIGNRNDHQATGLQRPDRHLATGTRPLNENVNLAKTVLHCPARGLLGRDLSRIGCALARSLKPIRARARPCDDVSSWIGQRHDRIVERGLHVGASPRDILPIPTANPRFAFALFGP